MKKKIFTHIIPITLFIFSAFLLFQSITAKAQLENIAYPITELGDCANENECKIYCDEPENFGPCIEFAEEHNLISKKEAQKAKKFAEAGITSGPGGCRGDTECETYCDQPQNMEECINFAEQNGLMDPEELEEAKKVMQALKSGAQLPGGCANKDSCDAYCEDPNHTEECVAFAEAAGFISPEEAEMVRKTGGKGPGNCRGKDECDAYCDNESNFEECISFAEENGLIDPEEAKMARLTGGKGPGGCKRDECKTYCDDISHMEECVDFGIKIGMITPEEAEQAKKMARLGINSGPGGCKGKDECDSFCNDPANMESCIDFAVQIGEMTPEEAEQVKKMGPAMMQGGPGGCKGKEECEAYCEDPANGEECMSFAVENGFMSQEEYEQAKKMGEMMTQGGPGGCRSEEECRDYCENPSNGEECLNFSVQIGQTPPEEAERMRQTMKEGTPNEMMPQDGQMRQEMVGPGGCQTEEECRTYCSDPARSEECGAPNQEQTPYQQEELQPPPEGQQYPQEPFYQQPTQEFNQYPQGPIYQQPQEPTIDQQFQSQEPIQQEPIYQEPIMQEPVYQEPIYQEPIQQEPIFQEPAPQEPAPQEQISTPPPEGRISSGFDTLWILILKLLK